MSAASWSVCAAILVGAQTGGLLECASERGWVAVASRPSDLVDRITGGLQQTLGLLDPYLPQVRLRRAAGGRRESSRQCTAAEPELGCQLADQQWLVEMRVDVLLDLVDDQVVMEPTR